MTTNLTSLENTVTEAVERLIGENDIFPVAVSVTGNPNGRKKVNVILDGDQGITIDRCAEISRMLGKHIESEELITEAYTLEVSSPGLTNPLKKKRQYKRHIGRSINVLLNNGKLISGKLLQTDEKGIIILETAVPEGKKKNETSDSTSEEVTILFEEIEKTTLNITLN